MLQWDNGWFNELCGINGEGLPIITDVPAPSTPPAKGQPGFAQAVKDGVCGYRSDAFRADAVARQQSGAFLTPPTDRSPTILNWECPARGGCRANPSTFFFTENDAHLSNACHAGALLARGGAAPTAAAAALMQNATLSADAPDDRRLTAEVRDAFIEYSGGRAGLAQWNLDFGAAFVAMSSMGAEWAPKAFAPTFAECLGGWRHATVDSEANRRMCNQRCGAGPADCPSTCSCSTAPRSVRMGIAPATGPVTSA
jgi:hypothetical protein